MPKKIIIVGDGITAREMVENTGDDVAPALEAFFEAWNTAGADEFERRIARMETVALAILKQANITLITSHRSGTQKANKESAAEKANRERVYAVEAGPQNPEHFALRILQEIKITRGCILAGDPGAAARNAVELGISIAEASLKFRWEVPALSGKVQREGAKKGHATKYGSPEDIAARQAAQVTAYNKMKTAHPKRNAAWCYAEVAKDNERKEYWAAGTIRASVAKNRKK